MEKEFIPYEQALTLKELGFDEPCFGKYLSSLQSDWKEFELILEMGMNEEFEDNRNIYLLEGACSAPTFSQAFRWFREKYKLYHNIKMFGDWDKPQYSYIISGRTMINPAHMWYYKDVNSYPEAELACLIKLIEIVKNNL